MEPTVNFDPRSDGSVRRPSHPRLEGARSDGNHDARTRILDTIEPHVRAGTLDIDNPAGEPKGVLKWMLTPALA
jgi:hypothetical protein